MELSIEEKSLLNNLRIALAGFQEMINSSCSADEIAVFRPQVGELETIVQTFESKALVAGASKEEFLELISSIETRLETVRASHKLARTARSRRSPIRSYRPAAPAQDDDGDSLFNFLTGKGLFH